MAQPAEPSSVLEDVRRIVADCTNHRLDQVHADTRFLEDLHVDSLDLVEIFERVEAHFGIRFPAPNEAHDQAYKLAFTHAPFTVDQLTELACLRLASRENIETEDSAGVVERRHEAVRYAPAPEILRASWSQLSDIETASPYEANAAYDFVSRDARGQDVLRRRSDGMPCVRMEGARATIGGDAPDERPVHSVRLSAYIIDLELVSTAAYCRFLNEALPPRGDDTLQQLFLLHEDDRRQKHACVVRDGSRWLPRHGSEAWPMILVSWFGARAYARWAHGHDPFASDGPSFLPSEAQWEFAVRGDAAGAWPWGEDAPRADRIRAGRAQLARDSGELPLGAVDEMDGLSNNGLRGSLGHVWQWCADWYAPDACAKRAPDALDPVHEIPSGVRSERGGSWVGSIALCRPAYRRGRTPTARGRCLGFRCAARFSDIG